MDRNFHADLQRIRDHLILMAEKSMQNTRLAVESLVKSDLIAAKNIIESDKEIDDLELDIDQTAIRYMALYQPVSADMRLIAVAIKVSHDIERIGDEATSIAKRVARILERGDSDARLEEEWIEAITSISETALEMLQEVIEAFVEEDSSNCVAIIRKDRQVDLQNRENFARFTERITKRQAPTEAMLELIFMSKSIERIADHVTNVAEEIIYLLSGVGVRHTGIKKSREERGS